MKPGGPRAWLKAHRSRQQRRAQAKAAIAATRQRGRMTLTAARQRATQPARIRRAPPARSTSEAMEHATLHARSVISHWIRRSVRNPNKSTSSYGRIPSGRAVQPLPGPGAQLVHPDERLPLTGAHSGRRDRHGRPGRAAHSCGRRPAKPPPTRTPPETEHPAPSASAHEPRRASRSHRQPKPDQARWRCCRPPSLNDQSPSAAFDLARV